jgi:hypothetical protein
MSIRTVFGSLKQYEKGGIRIIRDDPKNYAFSNLFEVASKSRPWERVAVARNMEYVLEAVRAEGASPWYAAAHDEFALVMDGAVEIRLRKLDPSAQVPAATRGATLVKGEPSGPKMGVIRARRGHQALLPAGAAYQLYAPDASVILMQTIAGPLTVERWAEICITN